MSNKKVFSYIKGYSFSFDTEDDHIEAWCSSFSGLEKVFVNGELVSSQRNFSTNTSNSFTIGTDKYSTLLKVESLLTGPYICTLHKNGIAIKRQKLVFPISSKKHIKRILLFYLFIGGLFSVSQRYFGLTNNTFFIFLGIVLLLNFFFDIKKNKYKNSKPVMIDEEVS